MNTKPKQEAEKIPLVRVASLSVNGEFYEVIRKGLVNKLAVRRRDGSVHIVPAAIVDFDGERLRLEPVAGNSDSPIGQGAVLLPSEPLPYGKEQTLLSLVRVFIHRYVELDAVDEALASYYVLLSWRYDAFGCVSYLRFHGEWGSGKSRAATVIGAVCFRPLFCGGAVGPAPIFRTIHRYTGTLVLDEADDLHPDLIKVLLCGYKKGVPFIRCVGDSFEPRAFNVYGPKILTTRKRFRDVALESRCLTVATKVRTRQDIPLTLEPGFWGKAEKLRSMLLSYRFDHLVKKP